LYYIVPLLFDKNCLLLDIEQHRHCTSSSWPG